MDLKGKACLVTGGTSGIGAAAALDFVSRGAHVAVVSRTLHRESLDTLKREADAQAVKAIFIQADAGKPEDCVRAVAETHAALGRLDVMVHAAGAPAPGGFFDIPDECWSNAFDVHVHAVFWLTRACVPYMVEQGEGAIILIGSAAGMRGCLGAMAYGVVKGALPQFTRVLARELAGHNIRVNCVSPGVIRTPFQDFLSPEQVANNIRNRIPLQREGRPEDVSDLILALVQNDFITGENVVIDGGMTMRIV
jgi:NAD(P)-dependent dehydrogenase (short-subunit alcohol dehydrogenase family)